MTINEWIQQSFSNSDQPGLNALFENLQKPQSTISFTSIDSLERIGTLLQEMSLSNEFSEHQAEYLPVLFSSGSTETALAQLHDFCVSYQKQTGRFFNWSRPHTKDLLLIFGRSDFLARRLKRYPLLADEMLDSPFLLQKKDLQTMDQELKTHLDQASEASDWSVNDFKNVLRRFKYQEYLRVTIRDLGQLAPLEETLEELTSIAISCMRMALTGTANLLIHKNNPEKKPITTDIEPFMVLGMGKLGGNELNYSSDVDLIFVHDNEPLTGDFDRDYKLRMKIARTFIDVMSDVTEEGFVARVDMRLRPGGDRAPLVQSLDEMELYYSASGELWERLAMIKAKPVAGTKQTADYFIQMITPFVYRRLMDERLLQDVEKVKGRIEEEHLRENHLNVKLGVGGIREIEFFVQTFQLLYAGVKTELRSQSTMYVLDKLRKTEVIPERDSHILEEAYLFLRRVEHSLQLREEHQTHTLAAEVTTQQEIARILAYHDLDIEKARQRLLGDLKDVMGRVRSIFGGLFNKKHLEIEASIRNCTRMQHFSEFEQQFIESFAQQLASFESSDASNNIKNRFQRFFESVGPRLNYYRTLSQSPSSLSRLMRIAETSEMLWNYLLNHLDLLNQLETSTLTISRENWTEQLDEKLKACDGDEENEIDQLRQFKHTITFLIGSAELEGVFSYEQARLGLTLLAEVITQAAFNLAEKWLRPRFGTVSNSEGEPGQFAIIGLGKMGGRELTYHSDLDLIFIHSGYGISSGPREIGAQEYWVKLIQRMISVLTTITRTGYAYKLDTRLRPSGNSGVLVTPLDMYIKYHETSKPWEHQALIKGRIVGGSGNDEWFEQVKISMKNAVYDWTPPADMNAQINHLRIRKEEELSGENKAADSRQKNLKEGHGGMLDVEFMTQAMQLQHGRKHSELRLPRTLEALEKMADLELLDPEKIKTLQKNYKLLRLIENGLRLLYDESTDLLDFSNLQEETILRLLKRQGYEVFNLEEAVEEATQETRKIYLNYFQ